MQSQRSADVFTATRRVFVSKRRLRYTGLMEGIPIANCLAANGPARAGWVLVFLVIVAVEQLVKG